MSLVGIVSSGRRAALALMVDACTISRQTGESVSSDAVVTPTIATIYEGACRIRRRDTQARMIEVAADEVSVGELLVSVPITVEDVLPGDVVAVTASQLDPGLVGRRFTVLGVSYASQITARRLYCQEVNS
jgi:hypothetical protein